MSGSQTEFITNSLSPLLKDLVNAVLTEKPEEPVKYMIRWLQTRMGLDPDYSEREELRKLRQEVARLKQMQGAGSEASKSDSEDDEVDEEELMNRAPRRSRAAVSAEAYGEWNKKEDYKPRVIEKTQEQQQTIEAILGHSFMFSELTQNEKEIVVQAMEIREVAAGDMVITQGEDGHELFVVQTGKLKCFKRLETGEEKFFKYYESGECFGELALLYNAPRAACIQAETDCVLLSLDRNCFNFIVKDAAIRRRQAYEDILAAIPLLASIDPYERTQIADALKLETFEEGQVVIKEGEEGNKFYMIKEGRAVAMKVVVEGDAPQVVKEYGPGDYFGELALLKNAPRAASIMAKAPLEVISLDRHSFKRLLGPIENIFKRDAEQYEAIMQALRG